MLCMSTKIRTKLGDGHLRIVCHWWHFVFQIVFSKLGGNIKNEIALIYAKYDANLVHTSEVTDRKTK